MADAGVDYESLATLLGKEQRSALRLSKLDPGFYAEAEDYLRRLAEDAHREAAANPTGAKASLLTEELRAARRTLDDLYDLREHKVFKLAVARARGGDEESMGMTKGEHELYEQLVRLLRDARRLMLRHGERPPTAEAPKSEAAWPAEARVPAPAAPATPVPDVRPPSPPERPLAVAAAPAAAASPPLPAPAAATAPAPTVAPAPASARVTVRVLEAVAPFTASDHRTYRLAPEDVVALPKEAAKALVLHGKATYVTGA